MLAVPPNTARPPEIRIQRRLCDRKNAIHYADGHEGAAKPDNPDTRVFGNLETGIQFFVSAAILDDQLALALLLDLRMILEDDKRFGRFARAWSAELWRQGLKIRA